MAVGGGVVDSAYLGPLYFEETSSNKDGSYHLNGFFIRFIPPNITFTKLHHMDPIIYIFAEGYNPIGISGSAYATSNYGGIYRNSPLNGKNIALQRMGNMTEQGYRNWHSSISSMKSELYRCDLTKIPKTVVFLTKMHARFVEAGASTSDYRFIYDNEYSSCR